MCCTGEDTTVHFSEEHVSEEESTMFVEEEQSVSAIFESPEMEEEGDSEESRVVTLEFEELRRDEKDREEQLKDKKYLLLNVVCCSLVNKSKSPGQEDWDSEDSVWTKLINLSKDISEEDPQFLLKVAVYTRQELNIRITANFLLALAANLPSTKSHVRRYFCAAVQLPSDWLEVVRIYSTCFSRSLPMCLKKGLTDKFKQFSEYQLAKYNTRKHRSKHNKNKTSKAKEPSAQELKRWANLVRSEPALIQRLIMGNSKKQVVDKKQSEFSLKKMIKRLHIKEPAEYVMAILGRKYPSDAKAFTHSGIKGTWDRERAGKRMKLKEPETWEHLLCREGNSATTWEKLIDNNSLPFMAMLRNLRNMIVAGISAAHHKTILSRLTNKKAVIQSRQFPIRFLAAYKVIMELQTLATAAAEAVPSKQNILKEILQKIPKSPRFKSQSWDQSPKSRIRCVLSVPFVYRFYKAKRAQLKSAEGQKSYSVELLQRYRDALEKAVQISSRYNIPPLPGKTVILLNADMQKICFSQDFCLPPDPTPPEEAEEEEKRESRRRQRRRDETPEDPLSPTLVELGVLLSLMIGSRAEDVSLVLTTYDQWTQIKLESDNLLKNVRTVAKRIRNLEEMSHEEREEEKKKSDSFSFSEQNKVDNIIVVTECWSSSDIEWTINNYRKDVNNEALYVQIFLKSDNVENTTDRNHVILTGFSDQMLRFVAERGSSRLLDHVEHLDKVYNIPPPEGAKEPLSHTAVSITASPSVRWRGVRVFISSTFRDMHAERDVLVRSVFPELRRRAAPHRLYLQEVELRWGVTEEESGRAVELCLSEVCRSQVMVVLLGERYGLTPPKPQLPAPQHSWLASAPEGLSVTEMEIRQFEALYPNAPQRMFCYIRDADVIESVPVAWRADFTPESRDAQSKMAALKNRLKDSDARVTDYPSEWGGVVDGKPYLKNLEYFRSSAVLEDLWATVKENFIETSDSSDTADSEQEAHQEMLCHQFCGRSKLLSSAVTLVEQSQAKGGIVVLEGGAGEGKTVFMAALGHALKTTKMKPTRDIISYSASQPIRSLCGQSDA
ncbi:hypothetical protein NQD34_012509 [Periophthalmus magnuspinnatus]|nr:hypothetical protein NQD34_012509 [Periophthalmus magnuspinnatus]